MRRAFSWGVPLFAAVMTGIFVGRGLPDNTLRAAADPVRGEIVNATPASPTISPPSTANGNAGSYPIPAPLKQPKHLFHVIIRYEGDGFPDPNMLAAALAGAGQGEEEKRRKAAKSKAAQAKDTFQVIIRYEGDGIIDDNVAKVLMEYFAAEKAANAPAPVQDTKNEPSVDPKPSEQDPPAPRTVAPTPRDPAPAPRGSAPATPTIREKQGSDPVQ